MRKPLIAGNWKMYNTFAEAQSLARDIRAGLTRAQDPTAVDVLVCPPFPYLIPVREAVAGSPVLLGAQNSHFESQGAYTGEVSPPMLKDVGCSHVIVGHSERRQFFGEAGPLLAKKVRAALAEGLHAIYCVGETKEQREAGRTTQVVKAQIEEVVDDQLPPALLCIAYEPVWAIGTGLTATPEQAQEVHRLIRGRLAAVFGDDVAAKMRILYGGSVKASNAAELLAQADVDGALVGGASLVAESFLAIISAAVRI